MTEESDTQTTQTDGDTLPGENRPAATRNSAGLLMLAAIAAIAVPVVIGLFLLRGGSDAPSADSPFPTEGGVATGGMGGSSEEPAKIPSGVLPFTDIQASDIVIEVDPSGAGAVLHVTTNQDVACAVTFGLTAQLGSIATDSDMAGGGHAVHQPLMKGLAPGAKYFYRVHAIGPDGALYQSELMQFTYDGEAVAARPTVTPPAPNVASQANVSGSSSQYSDAFSASNAIDGDLSTEWSTNGDGDDAFIVLKFADLMLIEGVGFRTREMTDGTSITLSYTVTVDGKTTYGPFEAGPGLAVSLVDFTGMELRFDIETSTGGNTGAIEVEVYGESEMWASSPHTEPPLAPSRKGKECSTSAPS